MKVADWIELFKTLPQDAEPVTEEQDVNSAFCVSAVEFRGIHTTPDGRKLVYLVPSGENSVDVETLRKE